MASFIYTLPPFAAFTPISNTKYANSINPTRNNTITLSLASKSNTQYQENDDYQATLKALNSKGRFPRKSLGQHYMLNSSINEQLVSAANVKEGDLVLEIGPGTGSLTNVLVNAGATVLAIEKDPYMAGLVSERFADSGCVKVLEEDFTRCHIYSHMSSMVSSKDSSSEEPGHAKVSNNIQ
ncbi:RNA methyltransferase [Lithospermum erythrorhizon]|uniref:rRNA adenine N(6)-methyltransferase n=1 Tax=Lithospermum erythrorhizon TaxID=34254 RepID=A0AAV3P1K8_LITER